MSERYISAKERGIQGVINPSANERPTEKPGQRRVGEQIPYPLPTEAEVARSLKRMESMSKGGAERGTEGKREKEASPMERIKKLGSMLGKNITGLRMLGPTGRKIGKGLLLAYAFGLAAEAGAVWQAKNMHKDEMMRRLGQESIVEAIKNGEMTREEAIDLVAERSRINLDIKREMRTPGLKQTEGWAAAELGRLGAIWAGHELQGDKVSPEQEQQYVREFQERCERVVEEYKEGRGDK